MNLWSFLERAATLGPDRWAWVEGTERATYRELHRASIAWAELLRREGVGPGDRVAIHLPNGHTFLEVALACAGIGAISSPWNTRLAPREVEGVLERTEPAILIADRGAGDLVRALLEREASTPALPPRLWVDGVPGEDTGAAIDAGERHRALLAEPSDPSSFEPEAVSGDTVAQLYTTSGTTGAPKGVPLTHGNIASHAISALAEFTITDADVWAHVAPMFHLADAWAIFAITAAGGVHAMVPRFDPEEVLDAFEHHRVTLTNLVPTMLNALVKHEGIEARSFPALRMLLSGGAPIAPTLVERIVEVFRCEYIQTYGLTETSPYLTVSKLDAEQRRRPLADRMALAARTGRPYLGVEVRVVDEGGHPIPRDDQSVGEIEARGPTVTPGYWNDLAATEAAFHGGWFRTGDLARVNREGFLEIVDRKKDVVLSGGETIYTIEVENVLYSLPGVLEAAAYGVADEHWGERIEAAVVPRPGHGLDPDAVLGQLRGLLANYKVPKRVRMLEALPRTGSGKIAKRALRDGPTGG